MKKLFLFLFMFLSINIVFAQSDITTELYNSDYTPYSNVDLCETKCYKLEICVWDFENIVVPDEVLNSGFSYYLYTEAEINGTLSNGNLFVYPSTNPTSSSVINAFVPVLNSSGLDCDKETDICIKRTDWKSFDMILNIRFRYSFVYVDFDGNPTGQGVTSYSSVIKSFKYSFGTASSSTNIGKPNTTTKISTLHSTNNGLNPNGFPLLIPSVAQTQSQSFRFEGILQIDEDYTFSKDKGGVLSNITLGAGARIIVKAPYTLTLQADIQGCSRLWNRIEVEQGATLIVSDAKIRDATTAIFARGTNLNGQTATVIVENSEFVNNIDNISISGAKTTTSVSNSKFLGRNTFLPKSDGSAVANELPFCGIYLTNRASILVNGNNYFHNLANGIVVIGSSATIHSEGNVFKQIGTRKGDLHFVDGKGIYCEGDLNNLFILNNTLSGSYDYQSDKAIESIGKNYLSVVSSNITSYRTAINCYNVAGLNIESNKIGLEYKYNTPDFGVYRSSKRDVLDGINVEASSPIYFNIINNHIDVGDRNIRLIENHFNGETAIEGNYITNGLDGAIRIQSCDGILNFQNNNILSVGDTYIDDAILVKGTRAMIIENSSDVVVESNNFYSDGTRCDKVHLSTALLIQNDCSNITVKCNNISNKVYCQFFEFETPTLPSGGIGIQIQDAMNCEIYENEIGTWSVGVLVKSLNGGMKDKFASNFLSTFEGSDSDGNVYGSGPVLWLKKDQTAPEIGTQEYTKNIFSPDAQAINDGVVQNSLFTVNTNQNLSYIPKIFNPGWFKDNIGDKDALSCSGGTGTKPPNKCQWSEWDIDHIVKGMNDERFGENWDWIVRSRYYTDIRRNCNGVFSEDPNIPKFIDQYTDASIGKHFTVNTIKNSVRSLAVWQANDVLALAKQKSGIVAKIQVLDSKLGLSVSENNSIIKKREELLSELTKIQDEIAGIYAVNALNAYKTIGEAIKINDNSIKDDALLPDVNQKLVDDIYLKTVAQGSKKFDAEQWNTISDIANQCPYRGGDAVYDARTLYHLRDSKVEFNDSLLCIGKIITKSIKLQNITSLKLSPNPAFDLVKVQFVALESNAKLFLSDVSGKLLYSSDLDSNATEQVIDLQQFNTGVYFISLLNSKGQSIKTQKLFIVK